MSILDKLFRWRQGKTVNATRLVTEPTGTFTTWCGDAWSNDIYRGAVDAIARNIGKLKGSHVITYGNHRKIDGDCKLNRLLQVRPNEFMSAYDMLYKLATAYFLHNNAFALLDRDERGELTGIYPITATGVEMLTDAANTLYIRFTFRNGERTTFRYSDVIHLRRHFNSNELLGDDNSALSPALELAHAENEGITNGIRSAANIRGLLKITATMKDERLRQERDQFREKYLEMSNNGGIAVIDQKYEYTPIESKPVILSAEQTDAIKRKIYTYLGISESIISSSYDENTFAAFYESTLEPLATQMSLEFTSKVFSEREQAYGNSILFESGRLQFTSNATKIALIKEIMPLRLLTVNQALEILNLPAIEGGETRLQTLNVVDAEKANEYQTGKEKGHGIQRTDH